MVSIESILWVLLSLYMLVLYRSYVSFSVVLGSLALLSFLPPTRSNQKLWRAASDQGCSMGAVLVPVLLQAMTMYNDTWEMYANVSSFWWIQDFLEGVAPSSVAVALVVAALATMLVTFHRKYWGVIILWNTFYYSIMWFPSLHKVFTRGEWTILTCMATIALQEWILVNTTTIVPTHCFVALSGVIGCAVACIIATHVYNKWLRGTILVLFPLMTVEGALLWWQASEEIAFPRAATWLWNFLLQTEKPIIVYQYVPSWPRYMWLVYWTIIVLLALVLSPTPNRVDVVVVRKWFHLVAIFLFLPVTMVAPQLMSLSYAIALCVLAFLENMKWHLPLFQDFSSRLLDPQKDHPNEVIVSHLALIFGCAMPLWIYECVESDTTISLLLPLFGIVVLGVGDSVAALLGTRYGKMSWLNSTRTVEGSAAMWLVMALFCCFSFPLRVWLPAVTFTTLLEAFTKQIDNLVLPVAGAAVLLLTGT